MPTPASSQAILALESGRVFRGLAFGARATAAGEVVFNTSLSGYQEVLTDPSYHGQMVAMTNPQIGNTGINPEDAESGRVWAQGFIVRELSPVASNWRSRRDLDGYLAEQGVAGIQGIDTRALTLELRAHGALRGVISSDGRDADALVAQARALPDMSGRDLVSEVSSRERRVWHESGAPWHAALPSGEKLRIAAFDFGIKYNILRRLVDHGFEPTVLPAATTAEDVLALAPDGVFLSNGPGDPAALSGVVGEVRKLIGRVPMFGICLGHQILAQAVGGRTFKLKFGHHGGNHPVKNLTTGKVEITVQNHGFAVDPDSLPAAAEVTHWNLNDQTLEGFRHREQSLLTVQYHPESAPGPHDSSYLFQEFRSLVEGVRRTRS